MISAVFRKKLKETERWPLHMSALTRVPMFIQAGGFQGTNDTKYTKNYEELRGRQASQRPQTPPARPELTSAHNHKPPDTGHFSMLSPENSPQQSKEVPSVCQEHALNITQPILFPLSCQGSVLISWPSAWRMLWIPIQMYQHQISAFAALKAPAICQLSFHATFSSGPQWQITVTALKT